MLNSYLFAFNGKEKETTINQVYYNFEARIQDSRIGRFLSVDRLAPKQPSYSPYLFAGNKPIMCIDKNGDIEIVVNEYTLNKQGKYVKTYTYIDVVETIEDVRGINRTPYVVNVYGHTINTSTDPSKSNSKFIIDKVEKDKNTGLDAEQQLAKNDPLGYGVYRAQRALGNLFGATQLNDATQDKEITGEIKSNTTKGVQVLDGVLQMISLGRLSLGTTTLMNFAKWELADAIVTETTHLGTLAGFSKEQSINLGYYALKAAYQQKTGDLKGIIDVLDAVKDATLTKTEAINKLRKDYDIDVNAPADKDAAAKKVINKVYKNKKG